MIPEIVLPVLIPLVVAAISVSLGRSYFAQRVLAVFGTVAMLGTAIWLLMSTREHGILVMEMSNWPAPFGIVFVSDLLAAIMVVITGLMGVAIVIYSLATATEPYEKFGYYPLMHLLHAGVAGAFLTGDLFNMFVWFEIMLLSSFALLVLGGERAQMEGATKYVTLNLVSSAIFLSALGLLYGMVGTLNMADVAVKLSDVSEPGLVTVLAMMFMMAFGIKAGAFPLFFWLPASYHTPPVAISAIFAGLLTKVGVYALFRVFSLIFIHDIEFTHTILLWAAGLTMLTGVLGAASHFEFRRILSFHIISQIGYMLMGIALFTPLAIVGGVFYIIHHIIVKANLFLVSGAVYRILGSYDLKKLGGLYRERPFLALLFVIPALSLAGIPPLSGFFAKFIIIRAGIEAESWGIVIVSLVVGALTLYSMVKIWIYAFWKKLPEDHPHPERLTAKDPGMWVMYVSMVGLALCTLAIGLYGQPIYEIANEAAEQLLNPQLYIEAVLGGRP
jgi:multicomponent Na+:H+ antiporter subunit D